MGRQYNSEGTIWWGNYIMRGLYSKGAVWLGGWVYDEWTTWWGNYMIWEKHDKENIGLEETW